MDVLFYLSFRAPLPLIRRIPDRWLWTSASGLVAAVFGVAVVTQFLLPAEPTLPRRNSPGSVWQFWMVYFLPATLMLDFALGTVMARIVLRGRWIGLGLGPTGCGADCRRLRARFVRAVSIPPQRRHDHPAGCSSRRRPAWISAVGVRWYEGRFAVWRGYNLSPE
ncbi:hypothetical protein GCM10025787_36120 [Saccharopolyspora rosea]|uniref:Uncharacterized protein n=1 Tax=Saccharopolyspora rosea TaxID=524884 RepID=A0ABW3G310_9PSEU